MPIQNSMKTTTIALVFGLCALLPAPSYSCSVTKPISNTQMIEQSDAIVVATAEDYVVPPDSGRPWAGMLPDSKVRFKIVETIRGKLATDSLTISGELVETDDFNDQPPPYNLVRPEGRRGNCFAVSYRTGGRFLLVLKKNQAGELTPYWYALAPVNEQLRSANDPWLLWVRRHAAGKQIVQGASSRPPVDTPMQITVPEAEQSKKLIHRVSPVYPPVLGKRMDGKVQLKVTVGKDGRVKKISVINGSPLLVQWAIDAVKQWRFEPTVVQGAAVNVVTTVTIEFAPLKP